MNWSDRSIDVEDKFQWRAMRVFSTFLILFVFTKMSLGEDWPKYRHDLSNTGASTETGISSSSVSQLQLKWSFQTNGSVTASPAIATINGTSMAFVGDWSGTFHAFNAVTGQQVWSFQIDPISGCAQAAPYSCKVIGSSAAVATVNSQQLIYFGAHNGFLYALNPATGAVVWKTQVADPNQNFAVWSSPAVALASDGTTNVYVGLANAGNDSPCVAGQLVALDASTGAVKWIFNTIDQTSCPGSGCVGAGVWSSPAVSAGTVYVGTGNPGSTCGPGTPNATRYPDSILAINASNGQLISFFQAIGNDNADLDFGASPVIYSTNLTNRCTNTSQNVTWLSEPSKNAVLYTAAINSGGSLGAVHSLNLDALTIASPAVVRKSHASACGTFPNRNIVTEIDGVIYSASAGGKLTSVFQDIGPSSLLQFQVSVSPGGIYSAPAAIQDIVLIGGEDAKLHALNSSGGLLWTFTTGAAVESAPAISNGRVYVGSNDGKVYAFSVNGQ